MHQASFCYFCRGAHRGSLLNAHNHRLTRKKNLLPARKHWVRKKPTRYTPTHEPQTESVFSHSVRLLLRPVTEHTEKRLKKLESQIDALSASEGKGFQSLYEGIKDGNSECIASAYSSRRR